MDVVNVFIVDDDPDILRYLRAVLEGQGYTVRTAQSGEEALNALEQFLPEIIISDVQMGGMSGYELCRRIRSLGHDAIPFFFCTVLGSQPERIQGLKVGADEYLVKPVDPEELVLRVGRHIEKVRRIRAMADIVKDRESLGIITGTIGDVTIPDLLQLVNYLNLDEICLHIETPQGEWGKIFLARKHLLHAETENLTGKKAFFTMMGWTAGSFKVEPKIFLDEPTMDDSLGSALMSSITQLDECEVLLNHITEGGNVLEVTPDHGIDLPPSGSTMQKMLDLVEKHGQIGTVIAMSSLTELESLRALCQLLDAGIIHHLQTSES
ncbi:MAG TPA: response regulator [Thermoanaerobaculia bacterium]|nr:response regulator [Thermoanaerobaculia bacterium]HUM30760.1 response regulator [Thermoanaerobaculia bacterium]HXK69040.1 response regulator [Thermoanaerobaculia bacterium]